MPEGELHLPAFYGTVKSLSQVVDVDYVIPGCPPEPHQIWNVIELVLQGGPLPPRGSVLGAGQTTVCEECGRRKEDKKIPMYVRMKDGTPMIFAGIWEVWKSLEGQSIESCSMLTTNANSIVAPLHDRQPVILHPAEYSQWLDRDTTDPEKLKRFYQPYPADLMEMYPVSVQVNSTRNDSPGLIYPISVEV